MGKQMDKNLHRADKLYGYLSEHQLQQKDIADLLGISVRTVNSKMLGKIDWKMSEVVKICEAWGISSDYFC